MGIFSSTHNDNDKVPAQTSDARFRDDYCPPLTATQAPDPETPRMQKGESALLRDEQF